MNPITLPKVIFQKSFFTILLAFHILQGKARSVIFLSFFSRIKSFCQTAESNQKQENKQSTFSKIQCELTFKPSMDLNNMVYQFLMVNINYCFLLFLHCRLIHILKISFFFLKSAVGKTKHASLQVKFTS